MLLFSPIAMDASNYYSHHALLREPQSGANLMNCVLHNWRKEKPSWYL